MFFRHEITKIRFAANKELRTSGQPSEETIPHVIRMNSHENYYY